jgi:hypothetical protein
MDQTPLCTKRVCHSIRRQVNSAAGDAKLEFEPGADVLLQVAYLLFLERVVKEARENAETGARRSSIAREHVRKATDAVLADIRLF